MPYSLNSAYFLVALVVLVWLGEKVSELLKTLKRIEARLTLLNPLDEEKNLMTEGLVTLKGGLKDRAMHPDIWISKAVREERGLRGAEWKKARRLRRYKEKQHRD